MNGFERAVIYWAVSAVLLSLVIGGRPWRFPRGGQPLAEHLMRGEGD